MASQELERTLRTIHGHQNSLNIDCLKDIAGIRAALDVLSTYLGDKFDDNFKRFDTLPKCLETAQHLCSNSSQFVLQLFLLKQLIRHDGFDAVKERCKRKELKWIMPPQFEVIQKFIARLMVSITVLSFVKCSSSFNEEYTKHKQLHDLTVYLNALDV